jgi:hypothetical protein
MMGTPVTKPSTNDHQPTITRKARPWGTTGNRRGETQSVPADGDADESPLREPYQIRKTCGKRPCDETNLPRGFSAIDRKLAGTAVRSDDHVVGTPAQFAKPLPAAD